MPADVAGSGQRDGYRTLCDRKGMTSLSAQVRYTVQVVRSCRAQWNLEE
jgi:hypothetical protein